MVLRRITYAVIFFASIAVFIMTDNAIALFLSVILFALPLVSYLQLLFARKRIKFDFEVNPSCIRGKSLQIQMKAGLSPRFLAASVKVTLDIENTTFHKHKKETFIYKDLSFNPYNFDYAGEDSGRICVRIKELKIVDWLGICSKKVRIDKYCESMISPVLYDNISVRMGPNARYSVSGENVLPQKGNDSTEIFNVRDYVAGDSLRSVHWKLSSKFDSLKTKEYGSADDCRILILADMSRNKRGNRATDEQLNSVLDMAVSLSGALRAEGYVHSVGWVCDGEFQSSQVCDGESFVQTVSALMSVKVNEGNAETLLSFSQNIEQYSFAKIIFIAPFVQRDEWKNIGDTDVTAIVLDNEEVRGAASGFGIIHVPCGGICTAVSEYVL